MVKQSDEDDRRSSPRKAQTYPIEIQFENIKLLGPSGNLSSQGIYFVAEAAIPVSVSITKDGKKQVIKGKVVRVGSVNEKTLGIAVQFTEPMGTV